MRAVIIKSIICLLLLTLLLNFFANISYADNFNLTGYDTTADDSIKKPFVEGVGTVVAIIRIVGVGIAVIMLVSLAIKYMSSAPSERADIKKSAIQYTIGAVILFASTGILTFIIQFTNESLKLNK